MNREFTFAKGSIPASHKYAFVPALFNTAEYRELDAATGWCAYYILASKDNEIHGHVHFHLSENRAISPRLAPFGSYEFTSHIPAKVLSEFVDFVEQDLAARGALVILLKNPPRGYAPAPSTDMLEAVLLAKGYRVESEAMTSTVTVSDRPFTVGMHSRKKRKLKQSNQGSLQFQRADGFLLPDIYRFILACRKQKHYAVSITEEKLALAIARLPDAYPLFVVRNEGRIIAASITVRVNENILYHFLSDHERRAGASAPALVLMQGIYDWCRSEGISLFDLGTSMEGNEPKQNLLRFKSELGGQTVTKLSFMKHLS